ncbi:hypothetical protein ATANTOWER_031792 [Ataeniobius toweri]|uniref:Uncharacterized protein n=1 Tax=Ataeniobius toweri TaxID=208326 RepID=A0ABU7C1P1_9TELE|nr:hypothetical protein [Ataeniobius toweri]
METNLSQAHLLVGNFITFTEVHPKLPFCFSVTPLDVVKIRLQAQKNHMVKGKYFVYCNGLMDHICVCENGKGWYKAAGQFKGTLDAFYKIVCCEGITALWSGLPPTL